MSTSGVNIAAVVGIWLVYTILYAGDNKGVEEGRKFRINTKSLGLFVTFLILFATLYGEVGIFRSSVNRILLSLGSGFGTDIQGITATGMRLFHMLSGSELLFGRENSLRIAEWNVSGSFYKVFQNGWIGCILQYGIYLIGIRKLKRYPSPIKKEAIDRHDVVIRSSIIMLSQPDFVTSFLKEVC